MIVLSYYEDFKQVLKSFLIISYYRVTFYHKRSTYIINKKLLLVFFLLLSKHSFASGLYLKGGYNGEFSYHVSPLQIKESEYVTIDDNNRNIMNLVDYNPNYHSVLSANVAIGYQGESLGKGELELRSSQIKVDNVGLMEGPIFISFKLKGQQEQMKRTELNNDRIESKSIMANVYYQQDNGFFSFYPYVGVGLGVTQTKMFGEESVDSAYQLKVGLSHQVSNSVSIHIGYSYFSIVGNIFKLSNVKFMQYDRKGRTCSKSYIDNLTIYSDFSSIHGIELSMTTYLSNKQQ